MMKCDMGPFVVAKLDKSTRLKKSKTTANHGADPMFGFGSCLLHLLSPGSNNEHTTATIAAGTVKMDDR